MRSILAQFQFKHDVQRYKADGVPFGTYLYVPEVHSETKATFYEHEDEAHLIKICIRDLTIMSFCYLNSALASQTRSRGPADIKLE